MLSFWQWCSSTLYQCMELRFFPARVTVACSLVACRGPCHEPGFHCTTRGTSTQRGCCPAQWAKRDARCETWLTQRKLRGMIAPRMQDPKKMVWIVTWNPKMSISGAQFTWLWPTAITSLHLGFSGFFALSQAETLLYHSKVPRALVQMGKRSGCSQTQTEPSLPTRETQQRTGLQGPCASAGRAALVTSKLWIVYETTAPSRFTLSHRSTSTMLPTVNQLIFILKDSIFFF